MEFEEWEQIVHPVPSPKPKKKVVVRSPATLLEWFNQTPVAPAFWVGYFVWLVICGGIGFSATFDQHAATGHWHTPFSVLVYLTPTYWIGPFFGLLAHFGLYLYNEGLRQAVQGFGHWFWETDLW